MQEKNQEKKNKFRTIGKDEMNLLEYCIFSATNRIDRKTKSLVFEDPVYCNIEGRRVLRRLTVAFSAEFGRPTASDDELLVAMLKKTRDLGFESQRVYFTRYELLKILGWAENGQNYERIDQGLNRLLGTHLVWDNAFWDNEAKSWVDRKFSIIDEANLYTREKWDRARESLGEGRPYSWFKWSDVLFESFQAGYIKTIDLEFLKKLQAGTGKRLYRWLDKHFNNKKRKLPIQIPVVKLATQKLGFQKAPATHLQRMLMPAIEELEAMTYLSPEAIRFEGRGKECVVKFRPATKKIKRRDDSPKAQDLTPIAQSLVERGMSQSSAIRWAKKEPTESTLQIEHLDWLLATNWKPEIGTGAWLNAAIKGKFKPPAGFQTKQERANKKAKAEHSRRRFEYKRKESENRIRADEKKHQDLITNYLQSLDSRERTALEERAIRRGEAFLSTRLRELEKENDQMASVYRDKLIINEVEKILKRLSSG